MLRVSVRAPGTPPVVMGSGESLLVGRAPGQALAGEDAETQLRRTTLALPHTAAHVSRLVAEVVVGAEVVRLRWHGATEAQLSSLFDAPGGARRVALGTGMSALLDEGENHVLLLRGRLEDGAEPGAFSDLTIIVEVEEVAEDVGDASAGGSGAVGSAAGGSAAGVRTGAALDSMPTAPAPKLEPWSKEWCVALALAEPWLSGLDDYPRPPSNREIFERVREWHGYAWNLERPQRVDECIRAVAALAFGPADDPFTSGSGRAQNVRFSVGRRAAEVRLVTAADLASASAKARQRAASSGS